jgi:AcrR family transcriptional regulator
MSSAREKILEATIEILVKSGPIDFRIEELVRVTGQSVGGIYHHFGNREGLLTAAYIHVVREVLEADAASLNELTAMAVTANDIEAAVRELSRITALPDRRQRRWLRIEALTMARHNDELWHELVALHENMRVAFVTAFEQLQQRGLLRSDLDPYYLYLSTTGNALATLHDDLEVHLLAPDSWADHTALVFSSVIEKRQKPAR